MPFHHLLGPRLVRWLKTQQATAAGARAGYAGGARGVKKVAKRTLRARAKPTLDMRISRPALSGDQRKQLMKLYAKFKKESKGKTTYYSTTSKSTGKYYRKRR